jgi:hypothetical protein
MTVATLFTFVGLFLAIFVLEFLLLYASTALGNVDLNFPKWLIGAFLAAVVWAGVSYGGYAIYQGLNQPFAAENRVVVIGATAAGLVLAWAIPALLFVPVFPVSIPRGMLVSVFQLLLRIFLYVLITAVVMVVLAALQIGYGPSEKRSDLPAPAGHVAKAA